MASNESFGIVEWYGSGGGHRCGYCKSSDGNISDGMWAHKLTVQNYQDLIDRGWRRSGKYCYKPIMNKTCCPHYTIKMEAQNFQMNKSHKKIIKRVNKYLIHGTKPGDSKDVVQDEARDVPHVQADAESKGEVPAVDTKRETTTGTSSVVTTSSTQTPKNESAMEMSTENEVVQKHKKEFKKGEGADPNKPPCKKAKEIRLEKKRQKLLAAGNDPQEVDDMLKKKTSPSEGAKSLEDYLNEPLNTENCVHKLEIKLIRSNPKTHAAFLDSYSESALIFKKYQMSIHHEDEDDSDESQFRNFLVDSPLEETKGENKKDGHVSMGYGSFHQHYILDGKIIAVGVIDILPYCTSSVYLYYHPDYSFLALGTYTALQEIAFTRSLNKMDKELKYYYMGYYIHSCPKMKYKGQYNPSFLLCPETYTWVPIEKCAPMLDQNRYARFAEEGVEDENLEVPDDKIAILFMRQLMTYDIYKALNPKARDSKTVKKYSQLVGKRAAPHLMLFRSS